MSLPRILIPTRQYERKEMMVQFVGEYHLRLVLQHGLMPIMLPSMPEMMPYLEDELATAAGLLLMEGKDIDPTYYPHTAESLRWVRSTSPERDEIELKLLELALAQGIPIFGICRGSQLLNIACGGDLYTDVHNDRPERSGNQRERSRTLSGCERANARRAKTVRRFLFAKQVQCQWM